ncbi:MAG: outer membrane beta-barrel protein [Chitinophagaceae bacterium]|nr:outer membrane beta-barrel protein [Chitinophagaceae bacterium]
MYKFITLISVVFIFSLSSYAQLSKISGAVNDQYEKKPVQNAVIALLTPKDSVIYKFTRSDATGKYIFKDVKAGDYILITTHPSYADVLEDINVKGDMELPSYALISKAKLLQEVIVKTGSPLRLRGDTTVYTADSFKVSANANVEELLKKMPGIQVDKDGKIKAMGETVEKVLVDGEEFFGDDPGMAIKNLRADAVKEVQVFDKKSDQAAFTGIDDGKTQKTINLKLKDDKKNGYFGKIDLAAGTQKHIDNRFNNNLLFSSFKGKRKLSAFLLNGNTGQDGLSWQDEQKYGGENDNISMSIDDDGGMMFISRGSTSDNEPYVDSRNGFLTNVNAGAQYSNKWNDKQTFNFSPKYNSQKYINHKQTFTQTQLGDSVLNQHADETINIDRHNFKNRMIFDVKIDSSNSLKLTANANFYHTQSEDLLNSITTGGTGTLKNSTDRQLQTETDKNAYSGNLIFKHKFKKARRTLSLTSDFNSLDTQGKNFLKSTNQDYFHGFTNFIDQMKDNDLTTKNLSTKITYTEPLSKRYSMELGYQLAYNTGNNDQLTYTISPSGKYDLAVDSLSNQFKQHIVQNIPSFKINYADKKLKVNFGSGFGITNFDLKDITFNKDYIRNYINFYPTGNLTYTYKANKSIRLNYNGNTTQPTINQLQPLRNNDDEFNQYIGNPQLKPSFTNSFNLSHNGYNFIKDIFVYQGLDVRLVSHAITNNIIIDPNSAKTINQPINTDGNFYLNFYGGTGFKIKKINTRMGLNANAGYSKTADVINSKKSFSKNLNTEVSLYLSKSKEKKYDVSVSDNFSYNNNVTSQNDTRIHYNTNSINFNGTLYIQKVWSIITDYNLNSRQKTIQASTDLNTQLWNARLQRTFRKDEFTAYFSVRDILNQNIGIERDFSSNSFTEVRNERLKRYFLLGFTWNFKNKSAVTK